VSEALTAGSYPTRESGRPSVSLHYVVGEMNGKLDQLMAAIMPQLVSLREADHSHDQRLQALEVWQARIIGGGAVVLFLVTSWETVRYVLKH